MIRTKHLLLICVTLIVATILLGALLCTLDETQEFLYQNIDISLSDEAKIYEVAQTSAKAHEKDTESFIKRVRESLSQARVPDAVYEAPIVLQVPEEDKPYSQISSMPERGAVFACADSIIPQYLFDVPVNPTQAPFPTCIPTGQPIGILNSGGFLYSGVFEESHDADSCNGYLDERDVYHYHGESPCVAQTPDGNIGYAFDGFLIYPSIENGIKITNEILDACHGHAHVIKYEGKMVYMYHYHMTDEYPYSLGCFMGTVLPAM